MSILGCWGVGSAKIISENNPADGRVTAAKTCWWLKVNTKAVRVSSLDGARFPHIVRFTYRVNGTDYRGSRYVSWDKRCPQAGEPITVYFSSANPARYALRG